MLQIDAKRARIVELQRRMQSADFWIDHRAASRLTQELRNLEQVVDQFTHAETPEDFNRLEELTLLSGEYDSLSAIMTLTAGSGGTEAQDWTEMILRMYLRYADKRRLTPRILDISEGEEAGVKSATIEFDGQFAYGYLKVENGVHRLVRMSPFNADHARHTSFALVQVIPKIPPREITLDPDDIRVDVYRASGKGGQGVNTTDSAVRITHLPTGIVAAVQNERSQLQNKETALAILQSRLYLLEREKSAERIALIKGDYREAAWGNQIRSYVLAPYQLVKDHRTGCESSDPQAILDGEIQTFIDAGLRLSAETEQDNRGD